MKKILLLIPLFIIVACGQSDLDKCIDANTNTKDNKFDEVLSTYVESRNLMRDYNQYLVDDSSEPTDEEYEKIETAWQKGSDILMDLEYSIDDETIFDEANSEALNCFFYGDDYGYNDVYNGTVNYGEQKLKRCFEQHVVDAEGAEKICNKQGIY